MMSAQSKFIVWDWNGTLLDDTDLVLICVNRNLAQIGYAPIGIEKLRECQTRPLAGFYLSLGLNRDQVERAMENERNMFHDTYEPLAVSAVLRSGGLNVLELARQNNLRSLILSNHLFDPICWQLERLAIRHHFDEVLAYASRETQYKDMTKGQRLQHYMRDKNMQAANGVIIGDTIEEIQIARELGLTCIAITGGIHSESRLRAAQPDYMIHSLHELQPILQERGFVS